MKFKPYPYQQFAIDKVLDENLPGVGLFLDMGLGKTVITLTAFLKLKHKVNKFLVVAPKRVVENVWTSEGEKWDHLNNIKFSLIIGKTPKERIKALKVSADVYIIGRDNIAWLVSYYGHSWPFDYLVLDELSSFKNHNSKRFKSLSMVLPYIKKVIGLTGTPTPNGFLDLWSQVFLLDRGERLTKSYSLYRDIFFESDTRNKSTVFSYKLKKGDLLLGEDINEKVILSKIKDICFSMKTEDYVDIPSLINNDQFITMSPKVSKQYEEFEKTLVLKLIDGEEELTAVSAVALTNKLLQFSNGAVYDEKKVAHLVHDEKLDLLEETIEELNGENALIFYSFVSDKERIMNRFKNAVLLKTSKEINDWNARKINLLLAHPASAGHGLNLQFGGHNIIWYGCPWSLELYQQAVKRLHRPGINRSVINTRLIVKDTLEEKVISVLTTKGNMQNAIIESVKALIHKYQ